VRQAREEDVARQERFVEFERLQMLRERDLFLREVELLKWEHAVAVERSVHISCTYLIGS